MTRLRPLLQFRSLVVLAVLLAGGFLLVRPLLRGRPPRPDIVLIVWDTCRGDRVSVNGYGHPTTPRLEELAARGVTFRNCFTPSPWTPPAHASLFTGLLPRRHGLREGTGDRVSPGIPLLASTLAAEGYSTVAIVANPHLSETTGLMEGFGKVVACWSRDGTPRSGPEVRAALESWSATLPPPGDRPPVFLFVNLMDSHLPYNFEDAVVAEVRGDAEVNGARRAAREVTVEVANLHLYGAALVEEETLRGLAAAYDGAVRINDRTTGRMLDALERTGMLRAGLVVVTGDHGENLGEHGELSHMMSVHDPVLHVPLVIAWPGRMEGGRVVEEQVRLQDIYPTLLEAAGAEAPKPCGRDARSLLESPLTSRTLLAEYGPAADFAAGVRAGDPGLSPAFLGRFRRRFRALREPRELPGARKLVTVTRLSAAGLLEPEREELFDLNADPGELRNLLAPPVDPAEMRAADRLRALDR